MLDNNRPWMTITMMALVVMAAAVGGAVVIWGDPGALSFERYLDLLKNFAIAVGVLGIGRGIASFGRSQAEATTSTDTALRENFMGFEDVGVSGSAAEVPTVPAATTPSTPSRPVIEG